ncbi:MAG TPA: penicillin-binding protein activator [Rubricoccaceae bacterium]|nr:penicillin-binding protein activator [Rubricoccaceae bacterium]
MLRPLSLLVLFLAALASAPVGSAQPATADTLAEAESAFENGLASYTRGEYEEAARLFFRAGRDFGYNARTTAALLMAGKALYAAGDTDGAVSALTTLLRQYPHSRYTEEAERVRQRALGYTPETPPAPVTLGVILPASGEEDYLAQALFNGVRLAVDEHNEAGRWPVRMVFRDSGPVGGGAARAMEAVAGAGAELVIGPLFSEEAREAAAIAEREQVPLVAPLATDGDVSAGRRFVFQANPTFAARGRALARHAVQQMGLRRLGVVAETGTYGEAMGAAFADEARELGAEVPFFERVRAADWGRLRERVGAARLREAEATYFPVTGDEAAEKAARVLRQLEAMGGPTRPLGNLEWEDLEASRTRASQLRTVYDTDFHYDEAAGAEFERRYRALAGIPPERLSLIGYDVTRFLLRLLEAREPGQAIPDLIRQAPRYQGLAHRFDFGGGPINTAVFVMAYRDGRAVLMEE